MGSCAIKQSNSNSNNQLNKAKQVLKIEERQTETDRWQTAIKIFKEKDSKAPTLHLAENSKYQDRKTRVLIVKLQNNKKLQ